MNIVFLGNGGSPHTINWVRHLVGDLGHRVTVVSFDPVPEPIPGVEIHDFSAASKLKYFTGALLVRRLLRKCKPDIVLAYRVTSYGLTAVLTGFRPLVVAAMGRDIDNPGGSSLRRWAAMRTVRAADLIHSWSDSMTQTLLSLGARPERILTLPRGVNTDLFYPAARPRRPRIRILSTRWLDPYCRIDVILEAFARLRSHAPEVELYLAGEGPERERLERLAVGLGLADSVCFLGSLKYGAVAEALRGSDVYVAAVPSDGTSASLLEAMACGVVPVVVDNASNRVWVTDGLNGLLYPAGDPEALAERLHSAVRDVAFREAAAQRNLALIRARADWKTNMKRMEARQLDLCRSPGAGRK